MSLFGKKEEEKLSEEEILKAKERQKIKDEIFKAKEHASKIFYMLYGR